MGNEAARRTAFGPMLIVAADQHEARPIVRDAAARPMLPNAARRALSWRLARRLLQLATERQIPGIWGWMLCRKRYTGDAAERALANGAEAVVLLGAGLDTLALRVPALRRTRVYEVDLPGNIAAKRTALVRAFGETPRHVVPVALDFETGSLGQELVAAGWSPRVKTLFVWEGVTQYLPRAAVGQTLGSLRRASPGSLLALTYVRDDFMSGREFYGAEPVYRRIVERQRLWKTGFAPDELAGLLAEHGWRVVEDVGSAELAERYVAPSGRALPLTGMERWALAEKTWPEESSSVV